MTVTCWTGWWNALSLMALGYTVLSVLAGESVVVTFARFLQVEASTGFSPTTSQADLEQLKSYVQD